MIAMRIQSPVRQTGLAECSRNDDRHLGQHVGPPQKGTGHHWVGAPPQHPGIFRGMTPVSDGPENTKAPDISNLPRAPMHHRRTVGLAIPCRGASPQSPTPFHQTTTLCPTEISEATGGVMNSMLKRHYSEVRKLHLLGRHNGGLDKN